MVMNGGAGFGAFDGVDALDMFTGTSLHQEASNQPNSYRGPQSEGYDPSAAAPSGSGLAYGVVAAQAQQQHQQLQQQPGLGALHVHGFPPSAADYFNTGISATDSTLLNFLNSPGAPGLHQFQTAPPAPMRPQLHQQISVHHPHAHPAAAHPNNPHSIFDPIPMLNQTASNPMNQHTHVNSNNHNNTNNNPNNNSNLGANNNAFEDMIFSSLLNQGNSSATQSNSVGSFAVQAAPPAEKATPIHEPWLEEIKLEVSSLSLEPLSGNEVIARLQTRMNDVVTKFLPCVDFLVQCQQDLRKGLVVAQQQKRVGSSRRYFQQTMTPQQFWQQFVSILPDKFLRKNQRLMDASTLNTAVKGLETLRQDAKNSASTSCEAVKNSFLGGMKEGESWGLRKWLSRHGNALAVCTDLECILKACKSLDKNLESTKKLAALLRPLAKKTLTKLKNDVPASYQERSSAHPYLPFFHRLEAALRDVSQFDPEDDGVICLDDSDDDDVVEVVQPPPPPPKPRARKRKKAAEAAKPAKKKPPPAAAPKPKARRKQAPIVAEFLDDDGSSSGEEVEVDEFEVIADTSPWRCKSCKAQCGGSFSQCPTCGEQKDDSDKMLENLLNGMDGDDELAQHIIDMNDSDMVDPFHAEEEVPPPPPPKKRQKKAGKAAKPEDRTSHRWPIPASDQDFHAATDMAATVAQKLSLLAVSFRNNEQHSFLPSRLTSGAFWTGDRYADALDLFAQILRKPEAAHFMELPNDAALAMVDLPIPYEHYIKQPLSFCDIALALFHSIDFPYNDPQGYKEGRLLKTRLNMWRGVDLLEAIDLVLLNSLAYNKLANEGRTKHRARTNALRKLLWDELKQIIEQHFVDEGAPEDVKKRRKQITPTRKSETSGHVVYRIKN